MRLASSNILSLFETYTKHLCELLVVFVAFASRSADSSRIYASGFLYTLPPGNPHENPYGLFLYGLFTYIDIHSYIVFNISLGSLKEFGMFGDSLWDLC